MLKEQLLDFAINALEKAFETKEQIKKTLDSKIVKNYVRSLKQAAVRVIENRLPRFEQSERLRTPAANKMPGVKRGRPARMKKNAFNADGMMNISNIKKERKSSIRQAKEINSDRAESILLMLKTESHAEKNVELDGKKSLACLIWALGQAERASVAQGISVHDVSALLYKAHNINLYPINISRVIHSNDMLVRQSGQENRTKTYLLTPAGMKLFCEKFV